MNKCTNCGTELPDGVTACPTCGNPVGNPVIPAAGQPANAPAAPTPPKKKRLGLKIIISIIVIFFALFAIGSCATCSSKAANAKPWPTGPLAKMIPSMNKSCDYVFESDDSLSLRVEDGITKSDYDSYVSECKDMGFTIDVEEKSDDFEAYNSEGYKLSVGFRQYTQSTIDIDLDAPKADGDLVWPAMGLATKIPNPGKTKGSIAVDSSGQFTAYVGEMSKADYNAYVEKCVASGFDQDHSKSENIYSAKNQQGDSLRLEYQGFNTMYISMYAAGDEDDSVSSSSSVSSSTSSSESSSNSSASTDSGLKAAMDEYETFVDGYVAFMKKYNSSSNTASMAADYTKWMTDYTEAVEKIKAIDESKLNASDLKYYNEVMARCAKKLADASL